MKLYELCILLTSLLIMSSCVPESKKILTEVDINPQDATFINLANYQYEEFTDSLRPYFDDPNPTYRYLTARAFASHQDKSALDSLYTLLSDPVIKVRSISAYAIGQIADGGSVDNLIANFRQTDTMSVDNQGNGSILHSLGKIGNLKMANQMISAQNYRDTDTLLLLGRMQGIYEYALRNITSPEISQFCIDAIRNKRLDNRIRLYAAHCLSRPSEIDIDKIKFQIAEAMVEEEDPNIKMALASALRHTDDKEIQVTLNNQLELDIDYRIKCNIIRTLKNYSYIESAEKIISLLKDENKHVALTASEYLGDNGSKDDVGLYRTYAKDTTNWQLSTSLYKSIFKLLPYYYSKTINATRWQVQQAIRSTEDTFAITKYIEALGNDPGSYEYLINYGAENPNPAIRTAITATLTQILASENFNGTFQGFVRFHKRKIFEYLLQEMETGDEGMTGLIADAISDDRTNLLELIDSTQFLFDAKEKLKSPGQLESINAIERAIAKTRGVNNPTLTKAESSKLPDWSLLEKYNANTKVIIKTNKGVFKIDLYLKDAPGTVLNFLELVEGDYYDGKIFHRIVSNFVIQTGSPRGDNYGGTDYVIRSDLGPLEYNDEGYVGMASAGNDTESAQWFVTHSPTPHLNGKYSLFGKISEGMEVVHTIMIGDTIQDIIIVNQ